MDGHVVEPPELSLVVEWLILGPGFGDDLHGLFESPAGLVHGNVQFVVLAPLEAPANTKIQPAVAKQIDSGGFFGDLDRVVEG